MAELAQAMIIDVVPGSLVQGQVGTVQITGSKTNFSSASVVSFSTTGIVASELSVAGGANLSVTVTVDPAATVGPCDVTVTTGMETATGTGLFAVTAAPPPTVYVSPNVEMRGTVDTVQINGADTHFDDTSVVSFSGDGITISALTVFSGTTIRTTMTIDPNAELGPSDVTVTTGSEVATGVGIFTVELNPSLSKITDVSPSNAAQGANNLVVQLNGQNTHFDDTSVVSFAGGGITISAYSMLTATAMTATISIDQDAPPGASDVTVTTGTEIVMGVEVFTVVSSTEKAEVLREAVNTYLRQNHVLDPVAVDICENFIENVNQAMRGQVLGQNSGVLVWVGPKP
jgi:hypothetical protein